MAVMDTVRWGIIGVGDVTEIKSGPVLQQADRSELVAVMRRSGDKAADFARRVAAAGKLACVEKPMARTAERLRQVAAHSG